MMTLVKSMVLTHVIRTNREVDPAVRGLKEARARGKRETEDKLQIFGRGG